MKRLVLAAIVLTGIVPAFSQTDTLILENGDRFVGDRNGKGTLYSAEKGIVTGNFRDGVPEGVCTHYQVGGDRYHGEFRSGEYSGYGRYDFASGNVLVGEFREGKANGTDTIFYFRSKTLYIGKCKDGMEHGYGYRFALYDISKFTSGIRNHNGLVYYYEGEFDQGELMNGIKNIHPHGWQIITKGQESQMWNNKVEFRSRSEFDHIFRKVFNSLPDFPGAELTGEQTAFIEKQKYAMTAAVSSTGDN